MRVHLSLEKDVRFVGEHAAHAEETGFAHVWMGETRIDPVPSLVLAAARTRKIGIGSGILVAYARNPMSTAYTARELALLSGGRFVLGLGTQVRPHIERRFSMAWSEPVARLREYVEALHAIWRSWLTSEPLRFEGRFYRHTLMAPLFAPSAEGWAAPPVYLAGVGHAMTELAGEIADGYLVHPFTTAEYLREVTVPALGRGLARAGRTSAGFVACGPLMGVPARDERAIHETRAALRREVAFYASTPAYLPVLAHHGWDDLHREAHRLSRDGRWEEMADLVDDEILDAFAVVDEPAPWAEEIAARYGPLLDAMTLGATRPHRREDEATVLDGLRRCDVARAW